MDPSSSSHAHPHTPSHQSFLPTHSPAQQLEGTPGQLQSLPPHMQQAHPSTSTPHAMQAQVPTSRSGSTQPQYTPTMSHQQPHQHITPQQPQYMMPDQGEAHMGHMQHQGHSGQMMQPHPNMMGPPMGTPSNGMMQQQGNVFGSVMGQGPGQVPMQSPGVGNAKVYASVYSGIPVFEAMIRGISVMRRTQDSWVNATQILKVAGIPKSARTKILDKEILSGQHEKVQGGYGKYQGTWIPLHRGQELAAQYGVTAYLSPIFDFNPSTSVSALPISSGEPSDRPQKTPGPASMGYNPGMMPVGSVASPYQQGQYANGEAVMPGQNIYYPAYQEQQQSMEMTPTKSGGTGNALAPAANINGMGLPPSNSDVYIDQYGQPHPVQSGAPQYDANGGGPPAKRQKSISDEPAAESKDQVMAEDDDDDSSDEPTSSQPIPHSMRLSDKPLRPKPTATSARTRSKLLSLFSADETVDLKAVFGVTDNGPPADLDIDMVIDNQGHTALHWACALAKMSVVTQLIGLGADIHRGNYAGETPLIRSVLTTNHAESNTFLDLLSQLSASIRTLDHAHRTVIHHIALIAGVKGRAASARTYMANVLDWVSKEASAASTATFQGNVGMGLKNLIDVQDIHGDTALNVAARVGNKGLVKLLLDAGADKARTNKLGLKPQDFGVEVEALHVSPGETVVANLKAEIAKPERQSRDVQKNISAIFETINDTFASEMTAKQTKLNTTEGSVRTATRALADKRQQVQRAQALVEEMEQIQQRSENLRRAMAAPPAAADWTGRQSLPNENAPPAAFQPAGADVQASTGSGEIPIPQPGDADALVALKRLNMWEDRMARVLEAKMNALEGETADKAIKYRKLVSMCTKVPVERVDDSLDILTTAIESDGQSIDLSRIAGFMSRVKEAQVA